jgi:hypothetical protein
MDEFSLSGLFPVPDELDFPGIGKPSAFDGGLAGIFVRIKHAGNFTRLFPSEKRATD